MTQDMGDAFQARAGRSPNRARFAVIGLAATIAIAGCAPPKAVCVNVRSGDAVDAVVVRTIGGKIGGYQYRDSNGFLFEIGPESSHE